MLTYISSELREDAAVPIVDFLMAEMGHALALKEDTEAINGDGTSTYGGVMGLLESVGSAGIANLDSTETSWGAIDLSDFYEVLSLVPDLYRVRGAMSWLCSAAFKWQVMDRIAAQVNGAGASQVIDGQMRDIFLGCPVVLSDRMPTTSDVSQLCCLFGNFGHSFILGDRGSLRMDMDHSVAFTSDRTALRATSRYDIVTHDMGDDSSAGAVVGLKTAAS